MEEKTRARKLDKKGNPWVLGGTALLDARVPPPRVRYRKPAARDDSLPGSKFPPGTIPQVRCRPKNCLVVSYEIAAGRGAVAVLLWHAWPAPSLHCVSCM